jgi:hypothetical protein
MKASNDDQGRGIWVSVSEAKTIYSCLIETNFALEDWEIDVKVGVSREELVELATRLRKIITAAGEWGSPDT